MLAFNELRTEDERSQCIRELSDLAINKFSQRILEICDHPPTLQQIRKLRFLDGLSYNNHAMLGTQRAITTLANKLILCAHNLKSLSVICFHLNQDSITTILTLPRLQTIELIGNVGMSAAPIDLHSNSVLNASFDLFEDATWYILPSLPSLRWLSISGPADAALPPPEIRMQANVFVTLECLMLHDLQVHEVESFTQWIRQALSPNGPGLRLTHLRLEPRLGFNEEEIRMILSALHSAPMQDLVLDSLTYAEPEVFDLISDAFPNLRSLTLSYRGSGGGNFGDSNRREARWPYTSLEYAPRFANFTHLEHFAWNCQLCDLTPSPSAMLLFENNFPENWEEVAECALEFFSDEWQCIPRLFGTHCPTLKSFDFWNLTTRPDQRYTLHHTAGVSVEAKLQHVYTTVGRLTFPGLNLDRFQWPMFSTCLE